ncbi:hypothetical protein KP509_36G045300 [Ceratopteris richardii]|uniref:Uncharacterized protein n=1 Tax=Ceratopteris richardii TaxID=49495 RepID=A0A8T2QD50_CERRI|nr:hypothetical protein KP509_36G045300 [Ceratopteris richardii]
MILFEFLRGLRLTALMLGNKTQIVVDTASFIPRK